MPPENRNKIVFFRGMPYLNVIEIPGQDWNGDTGGAGVNLIFRDIILYL